jgi:hypothetical protein
MGKELVPETLYSNELTRLCARENYIECMSCCFHKNQSRAYPELDDSRQRNHNLFLYYPPHLRLRHSSTHLLIFPMRATYPAHIFVDLILWANSIDYEVPHYVIVPVLLLSRNIQRHIFKHLAIKFSVLHGTTPCSLVNRHKCLGEICCFHIQDKGWS